MNKLNIVEIRNFISKNECDEIIANNSKNMKISGGIEMNGKVVYNQKNRKSWTGYISNKQAIPLLRKISELANLPVTHVERLQMTKYHQGDFYNPHYDWGPSMNIESPRIYSAQVFLNDNYEGGQTTFNNQMTKEKRVIIPETGKLIMWKNVTDDLQVDERYWHMCPPVSSGIKYVTTSWWRVDPLNYYKK